MDLLASDLVDDPTRSARAEPIRAERTALRRRRWGKHASLAAVALGAAAGFLGIARLVTGPHGSAFDRRAVRLAGRTRGPALSAVAHGLTFFGGVWGGTLVTAAVVTRTRARPRLAAQVAAGALGGLVAELALKRMYRRERPTLLTHLEQVSSTSFPSGHAMAAASLYLTLAFVAARGPRLRDKRRTLLATGGAFATTIAATRVYLGVHWPTDVLAGLALGTAWACLTEAAFDLTGAAGVEHEALLDHASSPAASTLD